MKHILRVIVYEPWFTNHNLRAMVYESWFTNQNLPVMVYRNRSQPLGGAVHVVWWPSFFLSNSGFQTFYVPTCHVRVSRFSASTCAMHQTLVGWLSGISSYGTFTVLYGILLCWDDLTWCPSYRFVRDVHDDLLQVETRWLLLPGQRA